jgi:hypothetical protein
VGNQHSSKFPWSGPILLNCQNKFLVLPFADTGFSNYDVVNMLGKASKPKSGLAYAMSCRFNGKKDHSFVDDCLYYHIFLFPL